MKKTIKKISIMYLLLSFFLFNFTPIYANEKSENNTQVNSEFIEYVVKIFNNEDNVIAYDKNGKEITKVFLDSNKEDYLENDFISIKLWIEHNISKIRVRETFTDYKAKSPFVNQSTIDYFYEIINKNQANGEIQYSISGNFVWDRATSKITSKSNAKINLTFVNFGSNWDVSMNNVSTNSYLSQDKYYVTFEGSFKLRAKYTQYYITIWDIDCGTYSNKVTDHPSLFA